MPLIYILSEIVSPVLLSPLHKLLFPIPYTVMSYHPSVSGVHVNDCVDGLVVSAFAGIVFAFEYTTAPESCFIVYSTLVGIAVFT